MDQGRIEPTPAEQLSELRKARDRYAALAEKLHEGADPELEPDDILAQEQDALRILHAYERSVANSEVRMTSLGKTHRLPGRPLRLRTWLLIFVAISAIEGGVLLVYFRPGFFAPISRFTDAMSASFVPVAPVPAPFPAPKAELTAPVPTAPIPAPPIPKPQLPAARPQAAAPAIKAAPKRATPPTPAPLPQPATASRPSPIIVPPTASPPPVAPPLQAAPQQTPPPIIAAPPPTAAAPPAVSPPPLQQTQPQQTQPQQTPPAPRPAAPTLTRLEAIAGTHTPPPYPDAAKRLGETGTTQIQLAISPQGAASDCRIMKSSGSDRLDAAACSHVQQNWRWRPATLGGQPVAATLNVTIVWNLKDAR